PNGWITCEGLPARYSFRSRSGCSDNAGRCRMSQDTLSRAAGQPTTPRRHSQRKNLTSLASPGKMVLSTSKNAAMEEERPRWSVRIMRRASSDNEVPILPDDRLIDKNFTRLL